jgi:hypothetical protein
VDFYASSLDGFDIILGTHWVRTLGSSLWDIYTLTMAFWSSDHQVLWHGILASQPHSHSVVGTDLMKMLLSALKGVFAK